MLHAAPNRLVAGVVLSASLHALPLMFLSPIVPAAFVAPPPTELMIVERPPEPAPPPPATKPAMKSPGPSKSRPAAAASPSAIAAVADEAPAPLIIPGYRLTPGIGQGREPAPAVVTTRPPAGVPDREPKILSQLKIAYPDRASRDGLEGTVRLRIAIDAQGRVTSAKVLSGPGAELNEAAVAAILTARFEPAQKDGAPVATSMIYQYVFTLE